MDGNRVLQDLDILCPLRNNQFHVGFKQRNAGLLSFLAE